MIPRLPRSLPGPSVLGAGLILTGLLFLPGCGGDTYSESMVYPVRTDPIITIESGSGQKPVEFAEPDRPGQLPGLRGTARPGRNPAGPRS